MGYWSVCLPSHWAQLPWVGCGEMCCQSLLNTFPKSTGQESYFQRWGTWTPFFGRTVDGSNNPKQHAKKTYTHNRETWVNKTKVPSHYATQESSSLSFDSCSWAAFTSCADASVAFFTFSLRTPIRPSALVHHATKDWEQLRHSFWYDGTLFAFFLRQCCLAFSRKSDNQSVCHLSQLKQEARIPKNVIQPAIKKD